MATISMKKKNRRGTRNYGVHGVRRHGGRPPLIVVTTCFLSYCLFFDILIMSNNAVDVVHSFVIVPYAPPKNSSFSNKISNISINSSLALFTTTRILNNYDNNNNNNMHGMRRNKNGVARASLSSKEPMDEEEDRTKLFTSLLSSSSSNPTPPTTKMLDKNEATQYSPDLTYPTSNNNLKILSRILESALVLESAPSISFPQQNKQIITQLTASIAAIVIAVFATTTATTATTATTTRILDSDMIIVNSMLLYLLNDIRSLLSFMSQSINTLFTQYPYVAAFGVCAFKAASADFLVQTSSEPASEPAPTTSLALSSDESTSTALSTNTDNNDTSTFEYKRNFAFFFYGGAYQGCIQEYIFNHFYPLLFGYSTLPSTVCKIVSFDMLVTSPLLCLPVAYAIKGMIYKQNIIKSMQGYIHDVKENKLLLKCWLSKFRTNAHILHIIQSDYYFGVQII